MKKIVFRKGKNLNFIVTLCECSRLQKSQEGTYLKISIPGKEEESKCRRPVDLCQAVTAAYSENVNWHRKKQQCFSWHLHCFRERQ
jgi:hypothetical protein